MRIAVDVSLGSYSLCLDVYVVKICKRTGSCRDRPFHYSNSRFPRNRDINDDMALIHVCVSYEIRYLCIPR